ncbi:MAG: response regulator transcription factor [Bacteroidota bacterium]
MKTKTIFIAKKQRLMCEALCQYCTSLGLEVVGSSTDGNESFRLIEQARPDYAIIEATLSPLNGLRIVEQLRSSPNHTTHVILYLEEGNAHGLQKALSLRVSSILFTNDGIEKLTKILLRRNQTFLSYRNKRSDQSLSEIRSTTSQDLLNTLTPAQLKILSLVGTHKTMPEIAEKLFISPHTVNNHIANIRRKLDLHGRGVVLKYALAIKHRLVEVDGKVTIANYFNSYSQV